MQSSTTTQFKQKTCPKCKNNHDNEGVLCSFCLEAADLARNKVQVSPPNFMVKCLIKREGDTTLNMGNILYTFKRNERGDSVCNMINQGHYAQILKSSFYEAYVPTEDEPEQDKTEEQPEGYLWTMPEIQLIDAMVKDGQKHTAIAERLSEMRGEVVSRQRVTKYLQSK